MPRWHVSSEGYPRKMRAHFSVGEANCHNETVKNGVQSFDSPYVYETRSC